MSYTMEQFQALKNRDTRKIVPDAPGRWPYAPETCGSFPAAKKPNPRGRHKRGEMNKSETAFSGHLEIRKAAGEIESWKFEELTFWLAEKTTYTPDFLVKMKSGDYVLIEVKALRRGESSPHWEDDSRCKIKVAARLWRGWFQFFGVHWDGGKWEYESF